MKMNTIDAGLTRSLASVSMPMKTLTLLSETTRIGTLARCLLPERYDATASRVASDQDKQK